MFGTVTKSAVATGADLVSYNTFSTSNYLHQPYNSDLAFGTGDVCAILWWNANSLSGTTKWMIDQGSAGVELAISNTTIFYNCAGNQVQVSGPETGVWNCSVLVRRDGILYAYLNGEEKGTVASGNSITNANGTFVGTRRTLDSNRIPDASLSLFRISGTTPSPEQIKYIYETEKLLFQENAHVR